MTPCRRYPLGVKRLCKMTQMTQFIASSFFSITATRGVFKGV